MRFFVKAVASGFAMALGSALFKKVSDKMGLDSDESKTSEAKAAKAKTAENGDDDEKESPEKETGSEEGNQDQPDEAEDIGS